MRIYDAEGSTLRAKHPIPELDGNTWLDTSPDPNLNGAPRHAYMVRDADGVWREDPHSVSASKMSKTIYGTMHPGATMEDAFSSGNVFWNMRRALELGTEFHRIVEAYYNVIDADIPVREDDNHVFVPPEAISERFASIVVQDERGRKQSELMNQLANALNAFRLFLARSSDGVLAKENIWRTELSMAFTFTTKHLRTKSYSVLAGQLDAVFAHPDYEENAAFLNWNGTGVRPYPQCVVVVDWKTSSDSSRRNKALQDQYKIQLPLYKWLLEQLLQRRGKTIRVVELRKIDVGKNPNDEVSEWTWKENDAPSAEMDAIFAAVRAEMDRRVQATMLRLRTDLHRAYPHLGAAYEAEEAEEDAAAAAEKAWRGGKQAARGDGSSGSVVMRAMEMARERRSWRNLGVTPTTYARGLRRFT